MVYAEIPVIHLNHVLEAKKYFQDDKNDNEQSLDYPSLVSFEIHGFKCPQSHSLLTLPQQFQNPARFPVFFQVLFISKISRLFIPSMWKNEIVGRNISFYKFLLIAFCSFFSPIIRCTKKIDPSLVR